MSTHATPPAERDLPAGRRAHMRGIVMDEVTRTHARRRVRRGRTVAILAAGMLLVMAVGAGAYALRSPQSFASLGCYAEPDREANVTVVSTDERDPVDVCAELWAAGQVGPTTQVPALTACVGDTGGAIWVLPGADGVCDGLGLERVADGGTADPGAPRVPELRDALVAQYDSGECRDAEEARGLAEAELDEGGFDGWTVVVREFAATDCASFALDTVEQSVLITGIPGPDSLEAALARASGGDCLDAEQASAAARGVLDDRGLDDWAVQVERDTFDPDQAALDADRHGQLCAQLNADDGAVLVVGVVTERP